MLNRRLNMVSRNEIAKKDHNRRAALRIFATKTKPSISYDLCVSVNIEYQVYSACLIVSSIVSSSDS